METRVCADEVDSGLGILQMRKGLRSGETTVFLYSSAFDRGWDPAGRRPDLAPLVSLTCLGLGKVQSLTSARSYCESGQH